jgi:hypothetical protein
MPGHAHANYGSNLEKDVAKQNKILNKAMLSCAGLDKLLKKHLKKKRI